MSRRSSARRKPVCRQASSAAAESDGGLARQRPAVGDAHAGDALRRVEDGQVVAAGVARAGHRPYLRKAVEPAYSARAAELLLDAQQLVVLRVAVRAGGRAGLDLAGARRDREVRDGGVLGLAGAVRDDGGPAGGVRHADRLERLGEGADLVELDQDGVGGALLDAAREALDVRDEEVVADELHAVADAAGERRPAVPVVLGHAVLDGDDGVVGRPTAPRAPSARRSRRCGPRVRGGTGRRGTARWWRGRGRWRPRCPGLRPASSMARMSRSSASRLVESLGAKPPSSPTVVA